ncbi:hypothetical protein [Burkholderia sp. MSHR3999]|uniref:hypothetical protein n=1 Tax=Burkholderia sp. MSHR3999 TaxID=1542965 RepID=UPI0012E07015|nr:hypothetical protein [Burkholderia sp. MSHR3999]
MTKDKEKKKMTISIAWVRKVNDSEELVFASDSRLSFGCRWDCSPKIMALPRGDAVMSFAGNTMYAYPVMIQAVSAVSQHQKLMSRGMNLDELKGHLLRILNSMVSLVHDLPKGVASEPDADFLFGGWSWKASQFKIWKLHFDATKKRFDFRPSTPHADWGGKVLAFAGDYRSEFMERLAKIQIERNILTSGGFDMEPFEVLRDMLRNRSFDAIGGAPQIVKVYKYSTTRPYAVFWPNREAKSVNLLGRPLLDYEQSDYLVLDPDNLTTIKHVDVDEVNEIS